MRYILSTSTGQDLTIFDGPYLDEVWGIAIEMMARGFKVRVRVDWGDFFMDILTREGMR